MVSTRYTHTKPVQTAIIHSRVLPWKMIFTRSTSAADSTIIVVIGMM